MKKKVLIIVVLLVLIVGSGASYYYYIQKKNNEERLEKEIALKQEIEKHYNSYVITNKDSKVYRFNNNRYEEYGSISKDNKLYIDETNITKDTTFFKVKDLDVYINYLDVDKIDEFTYNDRYKNYIPFNSNIKSKEVTNFYDEDSNLVYSFNDSFDLPIIIKDTNSNYK